MAKPNHTKTKKKIIIKKKREKRTQIWKCYNSFCKAVRNVGQLMWFSRCSPYTPQPLEAIGLNFYGLCRCSFSHFASVWIVILLNKFIDAIFFFQGKSQTWTAFILCTTSGLLIGIFPSHYLILLVSKLSFNQLRIWMVLF